jgi:hypothetical protein
MSHQVDTPSTAAELAKRTERRAFVRYVRLREARVRTSKSPTRVFSVALIREASANGLSLFLNCQVKEGTILEVAPRGVNFPRSLLARVVHSTTLANGWVYGCELANTLSDRELQLLLS